MQKVAKGRTAAITRLSTVKLRSAPRSAWYQRIGWVDFGR
jgi:hypothetical protein